MYIVHSSQVLALTQGVNRVGFFFTIMLCKIPLVHGNYAN